MKKLLRLTPTALTMCLLLALAALVAAPAPSQAQDPCEYFDPTVKGFGLPLGCKYLSPGKIKAMKDSAAAAELLAKPIHQFFICITGGSGSGRGNWDDCREKQFDGSNKEEFTSEVVLEVEGTGELRDYRATVVVPDVAVEVHSSAEVEGAPVQHLTTEMVSLQGTLTDHPDFDELTIVGGTANGFEGSGELHATYDPDRQVWVIDSHFDVGYSMSFRGAPGGPLAGYAGSGEGVAHMVAFGHGGEQGGSADQ